MIEGKVSVIIPVYNAEKFIVTTVNSVLKQSYNNLEVILIDDCSTDNTSSLIESINDDRVRYYKLEKNGGAAVARNKGINLAEGRYIAFLDSDDVWEQDKLQKQIIFMQENNSYFCYSGASTIDEGGNSLNKIRKVKPIVTYKKLLKNTMIITSTVVIDRNVTGQFQMANFRSGQDYSTWLMILRKFGSAKGINEPLARYRNTSNSLSSNKFKSVKQVYTIQRKQEKINAFSASFNTLCFILNAFKKHFL